MSKNNKQEQETKLHELETSIISNFSFNNGSLFKAAESLLVVKKNNLFKAVKKDRKMVYRTFKSYLEHFKLDSEHFKLLNKLITFHEFLIDNNLQDVSVCFSYGDNFWSNFMKIKEEFWKDAIKSFNNTGLVHVDDVNNFLKDKPYTKVGYSSTRTLPTPIQTIIANCKKLNDKDYEELATKLSNEKQFNALYTAVIAAKDKKENTTTVSVEDRFVNSNQVFSVSKTDNESSVVRFEKIPNVSAVSMIVPVAIIMIIGYLIIRSAESFISVMF